MRMGLRSTFAAADGTQRAIDVVTLASRLRVSQGSQRREASNTLYLPNPTVRRGILTRAQVARTSLFGALRQYLATELSYIAILAC